MRYARYIFIAAMTAAAAFMPQDVRAEEKVSAIAEEENLFAADVAALISKAWKEWQDALVINDVNVEGSAGVVTPSNIRGPVFNSAKMVFPAGTERPAEHIVCVRIVGKAVEEGLRAWQRSYRNENIPFPEGAACSYTLGPCDNVPVSVGLGKSSAEREMTEDALYKHMRYNFTEDNIETSRLFRAASKAISAAFSDWQNSCLITGMVASGGIAPQPAPMGPGPGAVRGAKAQGGKFAGAYIDEVKLREAMEKHLREEREKIVPGK